VISSSIRAPAAALSVARRSYQVLHTSQAKAFGGRTGMATSNDGALSVKLDKPKGLGGEGGAGTNPEQVRTHTRAMAATGSRSHWVEHGRTGRDAHTQPDPLRSVFCSGCSCSLPATLHASAARWEWRRESWDCRPYPLTPASRVSHTAQACRTIRPPLRSACSTRALMIMCLKSLCSTPIAGLVDIGKHDNGTLGIRAELRVHVPGWPAADVEKLIQEVNN